MSFGYREAGTGGVMFDTPQPLIRLGTGGGGGVDRDIVDSEGVYYPIDERNRVVIPRSRRGGDDSPISDVVTSANGFTGSVKWIGGAKITVTQQNNKIKISFDSSAADDSPWDSSGADKPCAHPGDESGGVKPDEDHGGAGGGGGGAGGGGGVPGGKDEPHIGDDGCCGNK